MVYPSGHAPGLKAMDAISRPKWVYPEGKQFGSALSLAAAFCSSRPLAMLFAPDGSKVHELEHDAGGVKTVVIGNVVMVSVEAPVVALIFANTVLSKCKGSSSKEMYRLKGKGLVYVRSQLKT